MAYVALDSVSLILFSCSLVVGEAGVGIGSGGFVAEQPALQISYRNAKKKGKNLLETRL